MANKGLNPSKLGKRRLQIDIKNEIQLLIAMTSLTKISGTSLTLFTLLIRGVATFSLGSFLR